MLSRVQPDYKSDTDTIQDGESGCGCTRMCPRKVLGVLFLFFSARRGRANCGLGRILTCPPPMRIRRTTAAVMRLGISNKDMPHRRYFLFGQRQQVIPPQSPKSGSTIRHPSTLICWPQQALCFGTSRPRLWKTHIYEGISPELMDETGRQP